MEGWTLDMNGTSIAPAEQNKEVMWEDLSWLEDNLLPIISPIKDVGVEFVRNVIYGVPIDCPIIFVSATEDPGIRAQERSVIQQFHSAQERDILWIPQGGETVKKFLDEKYPALIDDGDVEGGHREAIIIGSFAAKSLGSEYVAVVDGDNWSPMAIREFVSLYARGLRQEVDYVSLEWRCKPKCGEDGFKWRDAGRTSVLANDIINRATMSPTGRDGTGVISSSCSGEHAMTMELWDHISHTENHSGEVNAFVEILEGDPPADIKQFETMSPMFHQYGDESHIQQERVEVMRPLYHSRMTGDTLEEEIEDQVGDKVKLPNKTYPYTETVGNGFLDRLEELNL